MENQPGQTGPKSKINFWMISTIFLSIVLVSGSVYTFRLTSKQLLTHTLYNQPTPLEKPISPSPYSTIIQKIVIPVTPTLLDEKNLTRETITLKLRNWDNQEDNLKASIYKVNFDRKLEDNIQVFPATSYSSQIFDSYATITRKGAILSIIPEPEGGNGFSSIEKPEITLITGTKITNKPIYRLIDRFNDQSVKNGYVYTDRYEKQCSTNVTTKPCASGTIEKDGWGIIIGCSPDSGSVIECDDIFKSLVITRTEVTERLK